MAGTRTSYTYDWWEDARQATIVFDADTGSGSNALNTSTFAYDLNGRIASVQIADARPRTVTFVTDAQGQVLTRTEQDNNPNLADPKDQYWYFNGQRIGQALCRRYGLGFPLLDRRRGRGYHVWTPWQAPYTNPSQTLPATCRPAACVSA